MKTEPNQAGDTEAFRRSPQADPPLARPAMVKVVFSSSPSWLMRFWLWVPDWLFRVLGATFFFGYLALQIPDYMNGIWKIGAYYKVANDEVLRVPWGTILVHLTLLLIGLAFVFRLPPRSRATRPSEILVPLLAAFWPFLPFALETILEWTSPTMARSYQRFMWDQGMSRMTFLFGCGFIIVGNTLDVWGYGVLFRSLSIVAEARELKVSGPYRFVRHPVYLGQILAQGGVWLVYAPFHVVWITFYLCFVAMQLFRGRVEDTVLERAFGERYLVWKRKTFWFV